MASRYADSQPFCGYRGFKALKQSTKILFLELHRPEDALKTYEELLPYTKVSLTLPAYCPGPWTLISEIDLVSSQSAVTKNVSEKSINNILEYVAGEGKVSYPGDDADVLHIDADPNLVYQSNRPTAIAWEKGTSSQSGDFRGVL